MCRKARLKFNLINATGLSWHLAVDPLALCPRLSFGVTFIIILYLVFNLPLKILYFKLKYFSVSFLSDLPSFVKLFSEKSYIFLQNIVSEHNIFLYVTAFHIC